MAIKTFVISLAYAKDRQKEIKRQLASVPFEFWTATDGKNLNNIEKKLYQKLSASKQFDKKTQQWVALYPSLHKGEIGCYLSHYRLLQHIVAEKIPMAVILEDDIIFEKNWQILPEMLAKTYHEWDVVRLCGLRKRKFNVIEAVISNYDLVKLSNTACGTQAYMVSLAGAKKLLKLLRVMFLPVDITIDSYWQHDIAFYAIQPYPIAPHQVFESMIDETPDARTQHKKYKNFMQRCQKFWLKHHNSYLKNKAIQQHQPRLRKQS